MDGKFLVLRNDVGGVSLRWALQKQPIGKIDGDGRSCIGSFKISARELLSLSNDFIGIFPP